ncbi:MAG: hypothetical protein LC753_19310 [Acidobacteria bacterium]|nr:hypothetical protein [Acidobacteriota bacterium]MCA1652314.1 hypothetical protein [Acidobacteriota bacterium]
MRLLAAQGALVSRAHEQLALLVMLSTDPDPEVVSTAHATLDRLPVPALRAFLGRGDVSDEIRAFFSARGVEPGDAPTPEVEDSLLDATGQAEPDEATDSTPLASLPILDKMRLAIKGSREQRAQLIRDSNKLVAAAVLSSPKLTDAEVESFTKMGNVSEEVLRTIGTNRGWLKNYGVALGLTRNPKTPPALSMQLMHRLNERDVKMLTTDRNVPEVLRLAARKMLVKGLK